MKTKSIMIVRGIGGSIAGMLVGIILWIILGKFGIISSFCGAVIAVGAGFGYNMATKNDSQTISVKITGILISVIIMTAVMFLLARLVWTWEITDTLKGIRADYRNVLYEAYVDGGIYSADEFQLLYTDDEVQRVWTENFGFSDINFRNCLDNFSAILKRIDRNKAYVSFLVQSFVFAGAGAVYGFAMCGKNKPDDKSENKQEDSE
ncbi:MAG: hypothetical protein NC177_05280 [Ruminococcus flavefaciens]|nr:hypothetical protein [Ruminococcus flavefaciens]